MRIPVRRVHIRFAAKIAAISVAGVLLLLLVSLYFIPAFVSSQAVQKKIQQALTSAMKRQVGWSALVMSWGDGLKLTGLKLGDGPAPLLNTDIDQITISPSIGRAADGRFGIDLTVKIQNVRAELAPGPQKPKPPPPAKDPLTALAEAIQRIHTLDLPLPVDLRLLVEATPLQVAYHAPGNDLLLKDFSFRFSMPSLADKPITAELDGSVLVDGRDQGKVGLKAKVTDLVTKARRIHPAAALFAVEAAAPGTNVTLTGGLNHADGFAARLKLDLPGLLAVAQPFVPPKTPRLEGQVGLLLRAKTDSRRDLRATLTLDGTGLAASGGSLQAKRVGPLELRLQQQIATDHVAQLVDFPAGTLTVSGLIDAAWSASVKNPTVSKRSLKLHFGPLRLDLARALLLAAPFLPANAPAMELVGEAFIRSLDLELAGPANDGHVTLAGLGAKLPRVRLAQKKGELTAEGLDLVLESLQCPLKAKLPTSLTADLLWSINSAALSGSRVSLQGGRGKAALVVTDLNLKSASPRKAAASAVLNQRFDLDRFSSGAGVVVYKLHEQLKFTARAAENGEIEAGVPELLVTAASLQAAGAGKRLAPLPLSASLTASGIHLPAGKGGRPTLKRASANISAGDFMQLSAEAALSGAGPQHAATNGNVRMDLRRLMPFAAPFVPSGLKADGVAGAHWNLALLLPEKALVAEKNPLKNAKAALALFDKLEVGLKLDNISVTAPSAKGTVTLKGLSTKPDLRVVSTKKGESVRLDGGVSFAASAALPGTAGNLPSQHGSFAFNGELSGWRDFRLSESLQVDPLSLSHGARVSVSRIDSLLDEKQPFSTATLLKRLDATLSANIDGVFPRELKQLLPGIAVSGDIGGSVALNLAAGREVAFGCSVKSKDFGARLANGTKIEGLRSDIAINRVYALAAESRGERWTPLSAALVRPAAVIAANPGASEIVARISNDLRGDIRGSRSFSIRRVTTKTSSGVSLEISALEGDLLFNQEQTGLGFFQADLLGGTLLARGVFDLKPELPVVVAGSSFSNLDITMLQPKDARRGQLDRDAEITGELNLTAPLTADQRELLEQLRLTLNIRKIGANTLERALFSLDPYERNEQVVAQRKMLRLGGLKGLRANALDGAFSMEGEAYVKGVAVDIPKVERMRISDLPLRQELVKNRAAITRLRAALDLVRADTLVVGPKGELSLKRRMYAP